MEGLTDAALAHWKVVANTIAERASTCGVLSLSAGDLCGSNEQLLWSHYADNHKGVAVTYEIPYEFINGLVGCSPVTYDPNGLLEALRSLDLSKKLDFETGVKPVVTRFLTTKASHWEYECEARLISFKPGPVNIQREWVRQICFGLNTPLDDRAKVIDRTQQFGYSACQFAEVVHSDNGLFDFELREVAGH
jgi:hypothetical protein